jgi:Secretion system C-terminal sorting domain
VCILSAQMFAQTGYVVRKLNHVFANPDTTEFDQKLETYMKNISNSATTYVWVRTNKCISPSYGSGICIGGLCLEQTVDTRMFTLQPGDSTDISMHIYKNEPGGNATAKIEVNIYPQNTPSNNALLTFDFGACTSATTEAGDFAQMEVYPNPTAQFIRFKNTENATNALIFDQSGAIVINHDLAGGQQIDVSFLNAGMYIIKVQGGRKQSVRTFLKH